MAFEPSEDAPQDVRLASQIIEALAAMGAQEKAPKPDARPETRPVLLRVAEAAEALGIGKTKIYELIANKTISTVKIGASRRIPAAEIARLSSEA